MSQTERVKRLVLTMESGNEWNDAAPALVVLDIDPAHVIESLSRLESPCQAFARTLPDHCHEFNFEPPFALFFSADWGLDEQLFNSSRKVAAAWLPADFSATLAQSEVACARAEWAGDHWIISGLIGDSDDRTFTPPFRMAQLAEALQHVADVTLIDVAAQAPVEGVAATETDAADADDPDDADGCAARPALPSQ